jgi:hypothetical protein
VARGAAAAAALLGSPVGGGGGGLQQPGGLTDREFWDLRTQMDRDMDQAFRSMDRWAWRGEGGGLVGLPQRAQLAACWRCHWPWASHRNPQGAPGARPRASL